MTARSRAFLYWTSWHATAVTTLCAVIALRFGVAPWRFNSQMWLDATVLAAGYLLAALIVHHLRRIRSVSVLDIVVAGFAGFSPVFLYLLIADLQFSRLVLLIALTLAFVILGGGFITAKFRRVRLGGLAIIAVVLTLVPHLSGQVLQTPSTRSRSNFQITSGLYVLNAAMYRNFIPRTTSHHMGGGIAHLPGGGYLIVTSDGYLLETRWPSMTAEPEVERLPVRAPMNRDAFQAASGPGGFVNYFRTLDVLLRVTAAGFQILVSHHRWKEGERCFVVQVSALTWDGVTPLPRISNREWLPVHETEPCLPLVETEPNWPFRGMEGGGRMAMLDEQHLILTVGDHGFNSVDFEVNHVQDPATSYGKTVLVNVTDGSWEVYSTGHRNPQGLWTDSSGVVWLTEHGPQGGDELNRLRAGDNYGWPNVTYGTDYGREAWPLNFRQGRHDDFVKPTYSWIPSIGASNLIIVDGALFDAWQGDLLIGSLVGESLWRIRVEDETVRLVEQIHIGERIRDLTEDSSGRLVLLTDSYSILALTPTTHVYAACSSCHGPVDGSAPRLGPPLNGVVGRKIAAHPRFDYSEALKGVGGDWTEERLHHFLQDPQEFAPGTTMMMHGIGDEGTRADIIRYLSQSR